MCVCAPLTAEHTIVVEHYYWNESTFNSFGDRCLYRSTVRQIWSITSNTLLSPILCSTMAFNFNQPGTGGFSFGAPKTTAAPTSGFGLQTSTPAGGGFSFGAGQPQAQSFGNQPSQIAGLLAQPTVQNNGSMQGGFSFGAQTQSTTSSGGFPFGWDFIWREPLQKDHVWALRLLIVVLLLKQSNGIIFLITV